MSWNRSKLSLIAGLSWGHGGAGSHWLSTAGSTPLGMESYKISESPAPRRGLNRLDSMRSLRILLALAAAALAQYSDAGSAEFVFLRNFQGARAIGMIGIPAPGEDLSGMGLQPASFARLPYTRAEIGSRIQMAGVDQGNAAYATPMAGGSLAGRLDYQSAGEITGVDDHNSLTGRTHRPQEMLLDIAFAEPLGDRLSWGVGVKAVEENLDIDNSQAWGVGVDLGAVFQPGTRQLAYSFYVANRVTKLSGSTVAQRNY